MGSVVRMEIATLWLVLMVASTAIVGQRVVMDDGEAACSQAVGMNITAGIVMGPRKFVVTATDCCAYCVELSACVGAVYNNYFCTAYASISATATNVDGSVVLLKATPAPPTTSAPTPPPPTPAPTPLGPPSAYALLTSCSVSTACSRAFDPSCVTEVVPLGSCALDIEGNKYVSVVNTSNGVERHQFRGLDCSGTPESTTLYPSTCQYQMNAHVSRMGVVAATIDETRFYDVVGYQCSSAVCDTTTGCETSFGGPTEVCLVQGQEEAAAPPSSLVDIDGSPSSGVVLYYCFAHLSMFASFRFPRMESCTLGQRVVGLALPTQVCYYDDVDNHFWNSCNAA